eukprot:Gb_40425 [translate_table: standard]
MCLFMRGRGRGSGSGEKTRVRNQTDRPIYLQIRVGAILIKSYTLNPGRTKILGHTNILRRYSPRGESTFYYDGNCEPYVWIHMDSNAFSTMVKHQYVSLHDLRQCLDISISKDKLKGTFSVLKICRPHMY